MVWGLHFGNNSQAYSHCSWIKNQPPSPLLLHRPCCEHLFLASLHNAGVVVTSLSDQPNLRDLVCFVVPRVAARWYDLGIVLDVQPFILDGIEHDQKSTAQPRAMFVKWLQKSPGTGNQDRTWKSVLEATGLICGQGAVEEIRTAVHIQECPSAGE